VYQWPTATDEVSLKTFTVRSTDNTASSGSGLGVVCLADVVADRGAGDKSVVVLGFAADATSATPLWSFSMTSDCQTDADDSNSDAAISDDGSTVGILTVCRNSVRSSILHFTPSLY
jgi:hypothetical protein